LFKDVTKFIKNSSDEDIEEKEIIHIPLQRICLTIIQRCL
jgi:hypothetical protein